MDVPITTIEEPAIDRWRETHFEYVETLGNTRKSFKLATFLTSDELIALVRELFGKAGSADARR